MGHSYETVTLTRDVIGILIPAGTKVELPEGAQAAITQARPPFCITHAPGAMLITDLLNHQLAIEQGV